MLNPGLEGDGGSIQQNQVYAVVVWDNDDVMSRVAEIRSDTDQTLYRSERFSDMSTFHIKWSALVHICLCYLIHQVKFRFQNDPIFCGQHLTYKSNDLRSNL